MRKSRGGPIAASDLERSDPLVVFRGLLPFVWPEGRPDLRRRVLAAFGVLVIAKLVTVAVPVAFKEITDALTSIESGGSAAVVTGLGAAAVGMILIYGLGRILMVVLNQ
ncbi:MAG: metal ABC transporter permease, partial [Pseudomonadota bacterium]